MTSFSYSNPIYGSGTITEPVVLELIASPTLQRLKHIDQVGYSRAFFPHREITRFDHSLGVFLLLKKYGASLEEQIAGLIHDVSHSAFSHCIDYILADSGDKQDHQDNIFESYVRASDIPEILAQHGLDIERILDEKNFPLKERSLPDLCADRIDYTLLDLGVSKVLPQLNIPAFFDSLAVVDNQWIFRNRESAKEFAELFHALCQEHWAGIKSAAMAFSVGICMKYALDRGFITHEDLYTTDDEVVQKVHAHISHDAKLAQFVEFMENRVPYKNDPTNFDAHILLKSRVVDPLFQEDNSLKRISDVYPEWKIILANAKQPKEWFLKFNTSPQATT